MRLRTPLLAILVSGVMLAGGIRLLWYVLVEREKSFEVAPSHQVEFAVDTHPRVIELHSLVRPGYFIFGRKRVVPGMSADDLPYLYELLENVTVRDAHRNVLYAIACLGRGNEDAARALKAFIERPVKNIDYYKMLEKCIAVEYLGLIGGELAEKTLLLASTSDGAKSLSKHWYHKGLDVGDYEVTGGIRAGAARGLVYTNDPENIKIVEGMYDEAVRSAKSTLARFKESGLWTHLPQVRLYEDMAYALALRDAIDAYGLDSLFPALYAITWSSRVDLYLEKYLVLEQLKEEMFRAAGV